MAGTFLMIVQAAQAQPLRGRVEQRSFVGQVTGKTVFFNIYLPQGYDGGADRYPVIYHLHGLGSNQGGSQNTSVPLSFEKAEDQGIIGPVIVVFPNAYQNSMWADSFDGAKPAETNVIVELIPHVEANFRSLPYRRFRVVQGFSMGGYGAAKFASKFPDRFSAGIIYDGWLTTWDFIRVVFPDIAAEIFNNNEAYFNEYSPYVWTTRNAGVIAETVDLKSAAGILLPDNRRFRDHVASLSIPMAYSETGCGHVLECLLDREGLNAARLIADTFAAPLKGDFDGDQDVDLDDYAEFPGCMEGPDVTPFYPCLIFDFDGDRDVDLKDADGFLRAFGL